MEKEKIIIRDSLHNGLVDVFLMHGKEILSSMLDIDLDARDNFIFEMFDRFDLDKYTLVINDIVDKLGNITIDSKMTVRDFIYDKLA